MANDQKFWSFVTFNATMPRVLPRIYLFFIVLFLVAGCQTTKRVVILVEGQRRVVDTQAATVDDVLRAEKIQLGNDDRVSPPGYTPIERTATIQIVRVNITTEKKREPIEFARQVTRDESLPDGALRVVQLGTNGEAEVTFQITREDGQEVSRREISHVVLNPPRDEILVRGTQNAVTPVDVQGTLVYLAHGNAWVMRNSSGDKRPLTVEGDLDGRVFDLSPDGHYLIFTRTASGNLNTLWLADTVILEEKPRRVPMENLLYAQWAPDGSNQIAYATGEKTPGAPGWKAHNDLHIATLNEISPTSPITTSIAISTNLPITLTTRTIISPSVPAPYAWWGGALAWSPDMQVFAYAFANQVGFINAATGTRYPSKQFAYYNTRADWVWTPQVTWSPDSRFVLATVHALPEGAGLPEDSAAFDLWTLTRDNSVNLALARNVGMWAFPAWSPRDANGESKIAYGVSLNANSERARYALYVTDRGGSNRQKIFPQGNENGLQVVQIVWSPDVSQLVVVRDGDLWRYDFAQNAWTQLTANGDARLPRWK